MPGPGCARMAADRCEAGDRRATLAEKASATTSTHVASRYKAVVRLVYQRGLVLLFSTARGLPGVTVAAMALSHSDQIHFRAWVVLELGARPLPTTGALPNCVRGTATS